MRKDLPGLFLQRLHRYDTELIPGREYRVTLV